MIKCSFCQAIYVQNTLFCSECGNYLLDENTPETDPFSTDELRWVGGTVDNSEGPGSSQPGFEVGAIRLRIDARKREVEMPLDKPIHMGRMDPAINVLPEVDLSDDDIVEKAVSRNHARIFRQKDRVMLEDLGSANGTFINGKRLTPYLPEILNDGDTVQLGRLLIEVNFQARQ